MGDRIREFPQQVLRAWQIAQDAPLPDAYRQVRRIVVVGLGGSAIGGELLAGLMARDGQVPVEVVRHYELPSYVRGAETLVVGSSKSGNTEETLAAFEQARARGTRLLAMTTGGQIAKIAADAGAPVWRFSFDHQPRAALGYSFTLLLGLACRLGFYPDAGAALEQASALLTTLQADLTPETPTASNRAKQMAQALHGRLPAIFASGFLTAVARRWKGQFNENAKQWSLWDAVPEMNHNLVVGLGMPKAVVSDLAAVFLRSDLDHARVAVRWDVTRELMERNGIPVHAVHGEGATPLAQMLSLIHVGDFVSYYVAALNGADPTPVENIHYLKGRLAEISED
jgi:glucose/mannose-6-phosphate isomerase